LLRIYWTYVKVTKEISRTLVRTEIGSRQNTAWSPLSLVAAPLIRSR
jgi:hypothetical protein